MRSKKFFISLKKLTLKFPNKNFCVFYSIKPNFTKVFEIELLQILKGTTSVTFYQSFFLLYKIAVKHQVGFLKSHIILQIYNFHVNKKNLNLLH